MYQFKERRVEIIKAILLCFHKLGDTWRVAAAFKYRSISPFRIVISYTVVNYLRVLLASLDKVGTSYINKTLLFI